MFFNDTKMNVFQRAGTLECNSRKSIAVHVVSKGVGNCRHCMCLVMIVLMSDSDCVLLAKNQSSSKDSRNICSTL